MRTAQPDSAEVTCQELYDSQMRSYQVVGCLLLLQKNILVRRGELSLDIEWIRMAGACQRELLTATMCMHTADDR